MKEKFTWKRPFCSAHAESLQQTATLYDTKTLAYGRLLFMKRRSKDVEKKCIYIMRAEVRNLLARQDPTNNKIRHLVHLEDYRASAQEGIVHACRVIERINKWIDTQHPAQHPAQPFWDAGQSFQSRFSVIEEDLIFLRDQLIDISQERKELQQTLREHLELTHNRRNFILTIIAAVYLLLSFATSFFGMNINTTTPAGPQGFSNWTASWIADSPVDIQNSTKALASMIGNSGTETYPWKRFIITSVCLIITLPISLTFGTIFHVLFRCTTYYATYWRALAVVPLLQFSSSAHLES